MGEVDECTVDFDCPGNEICYRDVSWLPNGTKAICDCSAYWGFVGNDMCKSWSYHTLILSQIAMVMLGCSLIALFYNGKIVLRVLKYGEKGQLWRLNSANVTLLFTTISFVSIALWRALTLVILFTGEKEPIKLATSNEKFHPWIPYEKVPIGIAAVFTTLSALNVSLMWIDISQKSAKLVKSSSAGVTGEHKKKVYISEGLFILTICGASIAARTEIAVIAAIPFVMLIAVSYVVGYVQLTSLLGLMDKNTSAHDDDETNNSSDNPKYMSSSITEVSSNAPNTPSSRPSVVKMPIRLPSVRLRRGPSLDNVRRKRRMRTHYMVMLRRVGNTTIYVSLSLIVLLLICGFYAIPSYFIGYKELCEPGADQICVTALLSDSLSLGMFLVLISVQHFVYVQFKSQIKKMKRSRTESNLSSNNLPPASFTGDVPPSPMTGMDTSTNDIEVSNRPSL